MATTDRWSRAAVMPVSSAGQRRAEVAQLAPGLPDVATLFTFMRDAELRFGSLRLRLLERTWVASGERVRNHEVLLRHPGKVRVTTTTPGAGPGPESHVWLSDGSTVRTYRAVHGVVTGRPARRRPAGLDDDRDLPPGGRAYMPLTALPANTVVETCVHPAGFAQNVLATGVCRVLREEPAAGRNAIVLECLHPRTTDMAGDREDHRLVVAVDRETGIVAGLAEFHGDRPSRLVAATELAPDADIPDSAFAFHAPDTATTIF